MNSRRRFFVSGLIRRQFVLLSMCWSIIAIEFLASAALAQWTNVVPGVDYAEFTAAGPNRIFVTRMDVKQQNLIVDGMIGSGKLIDGTETVSGMVNRYNDTIAYWNSKWGYRRKIIAGINGDFFNFSTGIPPGGQIINGFYAKRFLPNLGGYSGFVWMMDRSFFIGGCVTNRDGTEITFQNGNTQKASGINEPRGSDSLIIYTDHYDTNTQTDNSGVEVLVELNQPLTIKPSPAFVQGTVKKIVQNQGSLPVPFDSIILSASGGSANTLKSNVSVGDIVKISQEIGDYNSAYLGHDGCNSATGNDWTKAYACTGGNFQFLKGGQIRPTDNAGLVVVDPRTAIAHNADYVYFVVIDGRGASLGMTTDQMGAFCKDTLGATDAINQDGGGSSAIWVDGSIKNNPSDGSERAVANGWMLVQLQDPQLSNAFWTGDIIETKSSAANRLGPGSNYATYSSVASGQRGEILAHQAAGVLATGRNWWKCRFGSEEGWFEEGVLNLIQHTQEPDAGVDGGMDAGEEPIAGDDGGPGSDPGSDLGKKPDDGESGLEGSCGCRTSEPFFAGILMLGLLSALFCLRQSSRR